MLCATRIALEKLYCVHALAVTQGKGLRGQSPPRPRVMPLAPCSGLESPSQPSPGHSVTYVDLSSVEPVLVDDPGNEAEASEPGKCPWTSRVGEGRGWGSCLSPTADCQGVAVQAPKARPGWDSGQGLGDRQRAQPRAGHAYTPKEDPRAGSLLGAAKLPQTAMAVSVTNTITAAHAGTEFPLNQPPWQE